MAVKPSNAINAGNATVNSVNFVDAIDPNNPQVDVRSPQWFSAFSSAWGYADNVAQVGGKSIPYANAVAGSSSVYSMIDSANTSGTINTRDLLGVSSALLGAAAAGIGAAAAAGTAPVWAPIALGAAALAAGAAGTVYKEDVNLGDVSNGLADDLGRLKDQFDKTLGDIADKLNTTKEKLSDAINDVVDKALEGEKAFGDWLKDKFDQAGDWWDQAQKDFGDWFIPFAKDFGDLVKLPWEGKYHIVDPMILDLDGDGIETMAAGQYQGALFDHNKDGIRTATGWVKPDDGLLALDRNGDGIINNGGELFGDSTLLADGSRAAHGYAALAELDSNGDGKVDAADEKFADLRVWRDLNSDGISTASELFTLEELGIASLDTAYKNTHTGLAGGNTLVQQGSFTKADGSSGQMGDVNFVVNNLYGNYADKIALTPEQMQAANLQGIGGLRDLREAAALSEKLALALKAYSEADSKEAQQALLENLVEQWAATNPYFGAEISISNQLTLTSSEGIGLTPAQAKAMQNQIFMVSEERQQMLDETARKLAIVNAFSGIRSSFVGVYNEATFGKVAAVADKQYATLMKSIYEGLLFQTRLQPYLNAVTFTLANGSFEPDFSGIKTAFETVHAENPKKAFVDLSEFIVFSQNNNKPVFAELSTLLTQITYDAVNAGQLDEYAQVLSRNTLEGLGHKLGTDGKDVFYGNNLSNYLMGADGNDTLHGRGGDDILSGGTGDDELYGGAGKDTLIGGTGNDKLEGGNGEADTYIFAAGHGQDIVNDYGSNQAHTDTLRFEGAVLADAVFTRSDNDLVIKAFGAEDAVAVSNYFSSNSGYRYYQFAFDDKTITAADMSLITVEGDGSDKNDRLYGWDSIDILHGGLGNDYMSGENGNDKLYGDEGNDSLYGGNGDDHLDGGEGNDRLEGGNGNDMLLGGSGNDELYGGAGKDTLIGGTGNDKLEGGNGEADTYIFAAGHGQDIVNDYGSNQAHTDTLRFEGAVLADAVFTRSDNDLVIKAFGAEDAVAVSNYFSSNSGYRYYQFAFDDKTITAADMSLITVEGDGSDKNDRLYGWDSIDILHGGLGNDYMSGENGNDKLYGDEGNDSLYGGNGDDHLDGGEGNDRLEGGNGNDMLLGGSGDDKLYGGSGNDTLIGGTGNDYLEGGSNGADTYIFAAGHGKDIVSDYGSKVEHIDTLIFEEALSPDVLFEKSGNDLIVKAFGNEEQVSVSNYFSSGAYRYVQFAFEDKMLSAAEVSSAIV